jgi:hypothetical protein
MPAPSADARAYVLSLIAQGAPDAPVPTARPQMGRAIKKAGRRSRRKEKKNDSGGGGILGDVLGNDIVSGALKVVDAPGRVLRSEVTGRLNALVDVAQGDTDWQSLGLAAAAFVPQIGSGLAHDKGHQALKTSQGMGTTYQDLLNRTSLDDTFLGNTWAKRGVGLAGDIATDPLTYIAPEAKLATAERAIGALSKPETVSRLAAKMSTEEVARRAPNEIARTGSREALDSIGKTFGKEAVEQAEREAAALSRVKEGIAEIGRTRNPALLDKDLLDAIGASGDLRAFGLPVVPNKVRKAYGTPINKAKVGASDLLDKVPGIDKMRGASAPTKAALRSGDPERAYQASRLQRITRESAQRAGAHGDEWARQFIDSTKGLNTDEKLQVLHGLGGDEVFGKAADVVAANRNLLQDIESTYLRETGERIPHLNDYAPREMTDEMRRLMKEGKKARFGDVLASFLKQRKIVPGSEFRLGGEVLPIPAGISHAQVERMVNEFARKVMGADFYKQNLDQLMLGYFNKVSSRMGARRALRRLGDEGLAATVTVDTIKTVATDKKAYKRLGKELEEIVAERDAAADELATFAEAAAPDVPRVTKDVPEGFSRTLEDLNPSRLTQRAGGGPEPDRTVDDLMEYLADDGFDPDATTLAHTTTAKDSVLREGLRPSAETGRVGLGQAGDTVGKGRVSASYSPAHSQTIEDTLRLGVRAASGTMAPREVFNEFLLLRNLDGLDEDVLTYLVGDDVVEAAIERVMGGAGATLYDLPPSQYDEVLDTALAHFDGEELELVNQLDSVTPQIDENASWAGLVGNKEGYASIDPKQIDTLDVALRQGGEYRADALEFELQAAKEDVFVISPEAKRTAAAYVDDVARQEHVREISAKMVDDLFADASDRNANLAAEAQADIDRLDEVLGDADMKPKYLGGLVEARSHYERARLHAENIAGMSSGMGLADDATLGVEKQLYTEAVTKARLSELDSLKGEVFDARHSLERAKVKKVMREEVRRGILQPIDGTDWAATPEIVDLMARAERLTRPSNIDSQFLDVYDRVLNWTKAWQLARPGFHSRNVMSIVWNNALAGVSPSSYKEWFAANHAYSRGGKAWHKFASQNAEVAARYESSRALGGGGQYVSEQAINAGKDPSLLPTRDFIGLRASRHVGHNVEGMGRGVLAMDVMKKGGTSEDAITLIDKFHFDYADLSRFERDVVKRIIPFYVWSRRNLPLQVEMLVKHPATFSHWAAVQRNTSLGVEPIPGEVIPEYYGDKSTFPTPFTEKGQRVYAMPDMPFEDINRMFGGGVPGSEIPSMVTPLIKTPIELWANKQTFKGIPLTGRQIELPTAHKFLVPALALVPGALSKDKKTGAITVREDIAYTVDQFLPMIANARRNGPTANEKRYEDREITQILNFVLGIGVRTNTEHEQKNERLRRRYAKQK